MHERGTNFLALNSSTFFTLSSRRTDRKYRNEICSMEPNARRFSEGKTGEEISAICKMSTGIFEEKFLIENSVFK